MSTPGPDPAAAVRRRLRERYLRAPGERVAPAADGWHHVALVCRDLEVSAGFYQGLLGLPLLAVEENRDHPGSTVVTVDLGGGARLVLLDLPGVDLGPTAEGWGGLHHLAVRVGPTQWVQLRTALDAAGVGCSQDDEVSLFLRDPDGVRLQLVADGAVG